MLKPSSTGQVFTLHVSLIVIFVVISAHFWNLNKKLDAMKPGPNEFRGHIYGNKISLPKRELELIEGMIRRDPSYGDAVLMQEGN